MPATAPTLSGNELTPNVILRLIDAALVWLKSIVVVYAVIVCPVVDAVIDTNVDDIDAVADARIDCFTVDPIVVVIEEAIWSLIIVVGVVLKSIVFPGVAVKHIAAPGSHKHVPLLRVPLQLGDDTF
jgi:hypothetical protein